jgi:hypothetical protein
MTTTGFKYFFGAAMALFVAAALYAWTSGGVDWDLFPGGLGVLYRELLGGLTLGWVGGVGDHVGYTVFLSGALGLGALAGFFVAFRDSEAKAVAEAAGVERAPLHTAPGTPNYWAPLTAFAVGLVALGVVTSAWVAGAGLVLLVLLAAEWMMQAWADRATGDPAVNQQLRNRIMFPLEIPAAAVLVLGFVVLLFSRLLLAVDKLGSIWITIGFAAVILAGAVLLSVMKGGRNLLVGAVALFAVAVLAAGVAGLAAGERDFETHASEEGGSEATEGDRQSEGGDEGEEGETPAEEGE